MSDRQPPGVHGKGGQAHDSFCLGRQIHRMSLGVDSVPLHPYGRNPSRQRTLPQRRCTTPTNTSSGLELTRAVSWAAPCRLLVKPLASGFHPAASAGAAGACLNNERSEASGTTSPPSESPPPPAADQPPPPRLPGVSGCLCATAARNQGGAFGAATKEGAAMVNTAVAVIPYMLPRAAGSDHNATLAVDGAGGGTGAGPHAGRDRIAGVKSIPSGARMWPGICRTPK